ncbi:hypothetical protein N431DRAFT_450747 [Stipitochalara longipes BDJ]|nr:hypothetical protein N431DRAFT_450747 [Stipitochalara longipes BDJ]
MDEIETETVDQINGGLEAQISTVEVDLRLPMAYNAVLDSHCTERHKHFPLDESRSEIRLATLCPPSDSSSGMIQCTLRSCSLNELPKYWALSYVWGDTNHQVPFLLDGRLYPITVNLRDALLQLCLEVESSNALWVDSICIDQEIVQEKEWQVRMMGRVYSLAFQVHIWLGPGNTHTTLAMRFIQVSATWQSKKSAESEFDLEQYLQICEEFLEDLDFTTGQANDLSKSINELLSGRSYWGRAWTFQELCLARSGWLWCGDNRIRIPYIQKFFHCHRSLRLHLPNRKPAQVKERTWALVTRLYHLNSTAWVAITSARTLVKTDNRRSPWVEVQKILSVTHNRKASNPLDHIYSILGLVNPGVKVDYSVSAAELFKYVCVHMHRELKELPRAARSLFSLSGRCMHSANSTLPSWVVDWPQVASSQPETGPLFGDQTFAANFDLNTFTSNSSQISSDCFSCDGVIVDEVSQFWTASQCQLSNIQGEADENTRKLMISAITFLIKERVRIFSDVIVAKRRYITGAPLILAVLRTFCLGQNMALNDASEPWKIVKAGDAGFQEFGRNFLRLLLIDEEEIAAGVKIAINMAREILEKTHPNYEPDDMLQGYHKLEISSEMLSHIDVIFGLKDGPLSMEDALKSACCALDKRSFHIILRPIDQHYEFMTLCYVDGIMDGEVAKMVRGGQLKLERLHIR